MAKNKTNDRGKIYSPQIKPAESVFFRLDGKNMFVECLGSSFSIGKVQIKAIIYDERKPSGSRQTLNLPMYIPFPEMLLLEANVLDGTYDRIYIESLKNELTSLGRGLKEKKTLVEIGLKTAEGELKVLQEQESPAATLEASAKKVEILEGNVKLYANELEVVRAIVKNCYDEGKLRKTISALKSTYDLKCCDLKGNPLPSTILFSQMGGTLASALEATNRARADKMSESRQLKIVTNSSYMDKQFCFIAESGPGKKDEHGLIKPAGKPEKQFKMHLTRNQLKTLILVIQSNRQAYVMAQYSYLGTTAANAEAPAATFGRDNPNVNSSQDNDAKTDSNQINGTESSKGPF